MLRATGVASVTSLHPRVEFTPEPLETLLRLRPRREVLKDCPRQRNQRRPPDCLLVHPAGVMQIAIGVTIEFRA